jgi:hypothetical protein
VYLDETLRVLPGFEAPHASLPLTRWLMRVFGEVVQYRCSFGQNTKTGFSFSRLWVLAELTAERRRGMLRDVTTHVLWSLTSS